MARQARRKQKGIIGTLFVELSALMGILGIAQPSVRNNLWSILNPPPATATQMSAEASPLNSELSSFASQSINASQVVNQTATYPLQPSVAQPNFTQPNFTQPNVAQLGNGYPATQAIYPPTYTAQATIPFNAARPSWRGPTFNPMGGFQ